MVTCIMLINAPLREVNRVANEILAYPEVMDVYSVTGQWDLVAVLKASSNDEIANLITEKLAVIAGIEKTDTMWAFKSYSSQDIDSMFDMGNA